jgi:putative membrane protein
MKHHLVIGLWIAFNLLLFTTESFGIILILLSISIVSILTHKYKKKFAIWTVVTYLFTMLLEILGTNTGLIFGEYSYGNSFGIKIFAVPLVIGLMWIILILGSVCVVNRLNLKPYWAGLLLILFDYPLEIIASNHGFWLFDEGISIINFITWGLIGTLFSYYLDVTKIKIASKTGSILFICQGLVFAFLAIL